MRTPIATRSGKAVARRAPQMPVQYEQAVRALAECLSLDEAKVWNDRAEALAAWAKIYHSEEATRKARALRLHAYRRMGELAAELRPTGSLIGVQGGRSAKGPLSLLMEHGLKRTQALAARRLAKTPKGEFEKLLSRRTPPSPLVVIGSQVGSDAWKRFGGPHGIRSALTWARANAASQLAREMTADEASSARKIVVELQEWLDEFEHSLPGA